jgi:hypothetical protein
VTGGATQFSGGLDKRVRIPLTPALSLRERENRLPLFSKNLRLDFRQGHSQIQHCAVTIPSLRGRGPG